MGSKFLIFVNLSLMIFGVFGSQSSEIQYQIRVWEGNSILCDGVVIGKMQKHVLIAAHCIENRTNLEVQAIWKRAYDENIVKVEKKKVVGIHLHPGYINNENSDFPQLVHDVAVLRLHNSLGIPSGARIVELPTNKKIPHGEIFNVNVWGLQESVDGRIVMGNFQIEMKILPTNDCQQYLKRKNQFCAVSLEKSIEFCASDRGSPFIADGIVIGLAAFSNCKDDSPIIFTKVSSYLSFINKKLKF